MRTRTVLFIPDPFAPEPLPIAVVVEAHGRTVVEPIPVLADLDGLHRAFVSVSLDDLQRDPSMDHRSEGLGQQVVYGPIHDPFKSLPRPIYDAIGRVLDGSEEEFSAARALRAENEHLRNVVAGLEQANREAHRGIAREKARTAIARAGAEVARGEVERLRAISRTPVVVTEDVGHLGTQWGVGFDGPDSTPERHVRVTAREDAFLLKSIVDGMHSEIAIREDGVEALRAVIVRANNALFAVGPDIQDAEHTIECHADTVPEAYRRLAIGANEAWGVLTAAVADMVESESK